MRPIEIVSTDFLILTLITGIIYYLLAPRAQTIWLLVVSYFFLCHLELVLRHCFAYIHGPKFLFGATARKIKIARLIFSEHCSERWLFHIIKTSGGTLRHKYSRTDQFNRMDRHSAADRVFVLYFAAHLLSH